MDFFFPPSFGVLVVLLAEVNFRSILFLLKIRKQRSRESEEELIPGSHFWDQFSWLNKLLYFRKSHRGNHRSGELKQILPCFLWLAHELPESCSLPVYLLPKFRDDVLYQFLERGKKKKNKKDVIWSILTLFVFGGVVFFFLKVFWKHWLHKFLP